MASRRTESRRPATSSERSRAARIRAKKAAGQRINRDEYNFLKRYQTDRQWYLREPARPAPASKLDRDYARNLRRRKRPLSQEERDWLKSYERQHRARLPKRAPSARVQAVGIALAIAASVGGSYVADDVESRWTRQSRPGKPGSAIANLNLDDMHAGDVTGAPIFPSSTGRRVAVRVRFELDRDDVTELVWIAVSSATRDWQNAENTIANNMERIAETSYFVRFTDINVLVMP